MSAAETEATEEPPRRPGAWPAGCGRPTPVRPQPPEAWQAAVDEFRAMTDEERRARAVCECGCTPNTRHWRTS